VIGSNPSKSTSLGLELARSDGTPAGTQSGRQAGPTEEGLSALLALHRDRSVDALDALLGDEAAPVRTWPAVDTLRTTVDDPAPEIRRWAARRLDGLAIEDGLPVRRARQVLDILLTAIEADGSRDRNDAERLERLCNSISTVAAVPTDFCATAVALLDSDRPVVTQSLLDALATVPAIPVGADVETRLQGLPSDGTGAGLQIRALDIRARVGDPG
jgi:hypothetical protein